MDAAIDICYSGHVDLIYVAIGCALGHYTNSDYPRQQYPPFIKNYPSQNIQVRGENPPTLWNAGSISNQSAELRHNVPLKRSTLGSNSVSIPNTVSNSARTIIILIDPQLEPYPRIYQELGIPEEMSKDAYVKKDNVTVIPIRESFNYNDTTFLNHLYDICRAGVTKLILQDFSGTDAREFYPTDVSLHGSVLFDVTYGDGGCFPDLNKCKIEMDSQGRFIQPAYSRLSAMYLKVSKPVFAFEYNKRKDILVNYVQRYLRILQGLEEPRDWCGENDVMLRIKKFGIIYNKPVLVINIQTLRQILLEAANDLFKAANIHSSVHEIEEIIDESFELYKGMLTNIGGLLDI